MRLCVSLCDSSSGACAWDPDGLNNCEYPQPLVSLVAGICLESHVVPGLALPLIPSASLSISLSVSSLGLCSLCSPLDLPLMIGLVLGDALVTLVIVVSVYFCTRRAGGSSGDALPEDTKVYMNMPGRG
ncbi:hematopoietic cell signal transducer isoform X1 [Tachyglossus aculeatus]|uniref:hematopoietic cell signal transducer isoform X1 n=1 Tax=Tachyglossus aculeatus TaxID=9261 RepID=UPI0018F44E59|nr:hematopoietic cell signal transducer isoform X1 [Tachyglossus aculeatus]